MNANENFIVLRDGLGNLGKGDDVGAAIAVIDDGLHLGGRGGLGFA